LDKATVVRISANPDAIINSGRAGAPGKWMICARPREVVVSVMTVLVSALTEGGLNDAAAPVGKPDAENVTVPGKVPPTAAVVIV